MELVIFSFGGVIAPGLAAIWMYAPAFFETAATAKLVFASAALTVPLIAINVLHICFFAHPEIHAAMLEATDDNQTFTFSLTIGGIISTLVAFTALLLSYLFGLGPKTCVGILLVVQASIFAVSVSARHRAHRASRTRQ